SESPRRAARSRQGGPRRAAGHVRGYPSRFVPCDDGGWGRGSPDDEGAHERGDLRHRAVVDAGDAEARRFDRLERRSIAFASDERSVEAVEAVLPMGETVLFGADVFDEEELTARSE